MYLKKKPKPLQSREALGFRGKRGDRSCFKCGHTEDNNYDRNGKLRQLKVKSIDKNLNNTRISNHIYNCERCR